MYHRPSLLHSLSSADTAAAAAAGLSYETFTITITNVTEPRALETHRLIMHGIIAMWEAAEQ